MKKGNIIVIIILGLLVIGLTTYIVIDKTNLLNNNDDNNQAKQEIINLDVNSEMVQKLYENATDESYGEGGSGTTYSYLYGKLENELLISSMSEKKKMLLVSTKLRSQLETKTCIKSTHYYNYEDSYTDKNYKCSYDDENNTQFISGQLVMDKYKEIFGNLDGFSYNTVMHGDPNAVRIYVYDESAQGYYAYHQSSGYAGIHRKENNIVSAVQNGNTIEIAEHIKYTTPGDLLLAEEDIVYTFNENESGNYYLYKVRKTK